MRMPLLYKRYPNPAQGKKPGEAERLDSFCPGAVCFRTERPRPCTGSKEPHQGHETGSRGYRSLGAKKSPPTRPQAAVGGLQRRTTPERRTCHRGNRGKEVSDIKVQIMRKRKADFGGDVVGTSPTHSQVRGKTAAHPILAFHLRPCALSLSHTRRSDER